MSLFDDLPRPPRRPTGAGRRAVPPRAGGSPPADPLPGSRPAPGSEARGAGSEPRGPAAQPGGAAPSDDAVESVGELTQRIDLALKGFGRVAVLGEVSRPKTVASGHLFFTLKDDRAALDVKVWRTQVPRALAAVGGRLDDGARVICHGTLDVYAPYGKHSLVVDRIEARGIGALLADLERLKVRLREEGLFDRRRPLPPRPRLVGVVTSRDADAWRDFLRTRSLRWPGYPVRLVHSRVQGRAAAAEIAAAIGRLDASGVDVIVVCRGGGAIEDLWCFNEEVVARAVAAASVPVVSGVGHETDTTLIDLVADHRAHTPTDAAQTVIPDRGTLLSALERAGAYLGEAVQRAFDRRREALERIARARVLASPHGIVRERSDALEALARRATAALGAVEARARTRVERVGAGLERHGPMARLARLEERFEALGATLAARVERRIERSDERLERAAGALARAGAGAGEARERRLAVLERALGGVSPLAVLERGYSITRRASDGAVVSDPTALAAGERLTTIVRGGVIDSTVDEVRPAGAEPAPDTP